MDHTLPKPSFVGRAWKGMAAIASTGAALVSVISFLFAQGIFGSGSRPTVANLGAKWIGLAPSADTAEALGDTLHLAATVTDKAGSVLMGARPTWTSEDSSIATVGPDGSVIARRPGQTTIVARIRDISARSRIVIAQRVSHIRLDGDTGRSIGEGERSTLRAVPLDARNHAVPGHRLRWRSDDSSVATLDSTGTVLARAPGRTIVSAFTDEGVKAHALITVVAVPGSLELAGGGAQRATAGTALPRPIVVRVMSRGNRPIEGTLVRFRAATGGRVEPAAAMTDADGRARATWTLSDRPGPHRVVASVDRVEPAVTITAEAEPSPRNTRLIAVREPAGDVVAATIAAPIAVKVTDSLKRPLAGVPVFWSAFDRGAAEPLTAVTDSLGVARARWTLGSRAGRQRLEVSVGRTKAVPPLVLTTVARPAAAYRTLLVSGDRQKGRANGLLAKPVVVRVTDRHGNGIAGAALHVAAVTGSVPERAPRTDSTGHARIQWTLGRAAGEQELEVRFDKAGDPLHVSARASAADPAKMVLERTAAATSKPVKASAAGERILVTVTDAYGNPVAKAPVSFTARGGTVAPANAITDAKGKAQTRWKPAAKAKERSVRAVSGRLRQTIDL